MGRIIVSSFAVVLVVVSVMVTVDMGGVASL